MPHTQATQTETSSFDKYCDSEELHDLVVIVENSKGERKRMYAHKIILAFSSPFFKAQLFSQHWTLQKDYS